MAKVRDALTFLNRGQTAVIASGQPIYDLDKQIQWKGPGYREDKYGIIFGGLPIEMASLNSIRILLRVRDWTSAMVKAEGASFGRAETYLSTFSDIRTRQAH